MKRFVLLRHEMPVGAARSSHFDIMFKTAEGLLTWAIDEFPTSHQTVPATELPVHRKKYLDYEGPVSQNRGNVYRADEGTYEVVCDEGVIKKFLVRGTRLSGTVTLTKTDDTWRFEYVETD